MVYRYIDERERERVFQTGVATHQRIIKRVYWVITTRKCCFVKVYFQQYLSICAPITNIKCFLLWWHNTPRNSWRAAAWGRGRGGGGEGPQDAAAPPALESGITSLEPSRGRCTSLLRHKNTAVYLILAKQ